MKKNEMHFQYTVFGPLDEFHGFIQICYYESPHISGIYLESLLRCLGTPEYILFSQSTQLLCTFVFVYFPRGRSLLKI